MEEFHDPGIHYFYFGWTAYGLLKKKMLQTLLNTGKTGIQKRNKRWLAEIKKLIGKNENIFIVVGAGHLVGRDGLVELFRKQTIKSIKDKRG
jgi:uncharacterized protein YbaP (TraB family)